MLYSLVYLNKISLAVICSTYASLRHSRVVVFAAVCFLQVGQHVQKDYCDGKTDSIFYYICAINRLVTEFSGF